MKRNSIITVAALGVTVGAIAIGFAMRQPTSSAQTGAPSGLINLTPIVPDPVRPPTPTAGSAPNISAPASALFSANFSNENQLAAWQPVDLDPTIPDPQNVPNWIIEDEALRQNRVGLAEQPDLRQIAFVATPINSADVALQAQFYDERNGVVGFVANYSDAGYYHIILHATRYADVPRLQVLRVVDGTATTLLAQDWAGFEPYNWHTIGLEVNGGTLTVSFDNKVLGSTIDPNPLPAGSAGLATRAIGGLLYDTFIATQP